MAMEVSYFYLALTVFGYSPASDCVNGIRTDLSKFNFAGGTPGDDWGNVCTNNLSVHSMWAAARLYCAPKEIAVGAKLLGVFCQQFGQVKLLPYQEVLPHLTEDYVSSLPIVGFNDINETKIWDHPVLISKDFFDAGVRTTSIFHRQDILNQPLSWAIYAFWGGILLIGIIARVVTYFSSTRLATPSADIEDHAKYATAGGGSHWSFARYWTRRTLIIPTAFGLHGQRYWRLITVPTRLEALVLAAFYLLVLIICCVSYEIFWPNLFFTEAMQTWRYIADRTGQVCIATLPFLWMFAGRNNIWLWLTGWKYSTFSIFHRHIARVATITAIVHATSHTVLAVDKGILAESWSEQYFHMGGMAVASMGLLVLFSSMWFRKKCYEFFLLVHIALAVIVVVALFYHIKPFEGEYEPYLWPIVAIWSFDRFARFVRLVYCNLHVRLSGRPATTSTTATYLKDGDVIRLEVSPGSRMLKPGPGQHYFIYQPATWKTWENHPFTLATWHPTHANAKSPKISISSTDTTLLRKAVEVEEMPPNSPTGSSSSRTSSSSPLEKQHAADEHDAKYKLVFFVRPYSGWTKRLKAECLKSSSGSVNPKVLIEGPYGGCKPLHLYENVIFIVGGTGLSGALPYLLDHVSRTSEGVSTRTRDITFIWTTKQASLIWDVAARELQPLLDRDDVRMHFHATSDHGNNVEKTDEISPQLGISRGRPDVRHHILTLAEEIHAAGSKGGKVAILACGPAGVAADARHAVHEALKHGKRNIEYFEETFGW
ncbi:ferric-chelate reductase [Exophiala viscosa]|uniref:Ferric-chelate reductase n=1 Tax=Exophiala viscosa TaxID=2486360 RepID=A0AAN6DQM5_9EURO|nr:ferric-chelate reductase [Exophiala viscosa]